jgi:N-methyl-L-proline demethylase
MSKDPLLQPFQLKHLTLRNRIMTTSHEPAYPDDGMPKDRYRLYHLERAKAGVALTMTAGSAAVSRDSPPVFNNILAYKDEVVGWMKRLTDDCHEAGAAVMIQLTHLGRRTRWDKGDWLPVVGAGPAREPSHRAFPKIIEDWDIARIVEDYADAAERMKEAGLDGVEFECYGHLMDQFVSPLTNALAHPYGGSLENRLRFAMDVLEACRKRVGPGFLLGVRYTADEEEKGGISVAEGLEMAHRFKASGLVDFLNIIRGRIHTDAALTGVIPLQGMRSAPHLDFAGMIRGQVGMPTFHAARIPDVATARHAIATGQLDMVGMTRAHMADPHIVPRSWKAASRTSAPAWALPIASTASIRAAWRSASTTPRRAARRRCRTPSRPRNRGSTSSSSAPVPAGLEAARVAAERGHHVTVFEAAGEPGGQVRLTARTKRRAEMIGIIDWRMAQCAARGVVFRFNTFAEVPDVLAEKPDTVIIATGGLPEKNILDSGNDLTVSAWDILSGDVKPAANVLLFDDAGDHTAMQAAQFLAEAGSTVEVMTPDRSFAPRSWA